MHRLAGTSRRAWGKLTRPSSCERPGPVKGVGEERCGPLQRRVRGLSGTGVPARCGVSGARTASRAARPAGVLQSTAKVKVVAMVTEWRGNVQQLVLSTDACSMYEGVKVCPGLLCRALGRSAFTAHSSRSESGRGTGAFKCCSRSSRACLWQRLESPTRGTMA